MKFALTASAFAGAMLFASGAFAMPAASGLAQPAQADGYVTHVAQGCGAGGWRTPSGRCAYGRPGYAPAPRYAPPPRYYGPPRCFVRHTPYGPRRVCR
ncbi:hypothetical protein GCM10019059_29910 [Camelimonas fluminis]|uniref:GCG_CRPN prefix-to-repeats domain-containing protein n=1 Tax=Camelimonas fluminis TaxID=1576911 RepID=A0ABV7UI65_9HYPH|nr:hypothetical protein [Camelimonas fluminis]GHE68069.1 hypothetical protein GCM10019059_29910 [Camelimonas fluminis]